MALGYLIHRIEPNWLIIEVGDKLKDFAASLHELLSIFDSNLVNSLQAI
jgi:hypothetical protein